MSGVSPFRFAVVGVVAGAASYWWLGKSEKGAGSAPVPVSGLAPVGIALVAGGVAASVGYKNLGLGTAAGAAAALVMHRTAVQRSLLSAWQAGHPAALSGPAPRPGQVSAPAHPAPAPALEAPAPVRASMPEVDEARLERIRRSAGDVLAVTGREEDLTPDQLADYVAALRVLRELQERLTPRFVFLTGELRADVRELQRRNPTMVQHGDRPDKLDRQMQTGIRSWLSDMRESLTAAPDGTSLGGSGGPVYV